MSNHKTRVEWTGNIQVHHTDRYTATEEDPQPCSAPCGNREPCWGCD